MLKLTFEQELNWGGSERETRGKEAVMAGRNEGVQEEDVQSGDIKDCRAVIDDCSNK